jgi:membrane protease subunit (stomatin/prohibitin family)
MFREIKEKEKKIKDDDPEIISWQRKASKENDQKLVKIFPQPGETIKEKKYFAVKDYEKALFYNKGVLVGVLGGGVYEIEKQARIKGTEIVWVDTSLVELPWGIPKKTGIPTKEGCLVGIHGDLKLKVSEAKAFYTNVVAGKKEWNSEDLKAWIQSLLLTSLRDIFKLYSVNCILMDDREKVIAEITAKVTEEFLTYGLDLEAFNIIGLKAPEDIENINEDVVHQRKMLNDRIKELKLKRMKLQDDLLNNKTSQLDYDIKFKQISEFIDNAQDELKKLDVANLKK